MELLAPFILGVLGSLHCAGMCGPLVLALPATSTSTSAFVLGRAAYNLGRILTYVFLGAILGLVGHSLTLAGFQRWLSLASGAAILLGLGLSSRYALSAPATKATAWLKAGFASALQKRTHTSLLLLGLLNGFLPCGLVYAACAVAVATGSFFASASYMLAFGLGTIPMMLGIGLAGKRLQFALRLKFQRLIPVSLLLLGALLILRGLALGIPYVSPDLGGEPAKCCSWR